MIFWVCNGLHFTLCHFCNQSEVKSNFPALGNLSSICFELWLVHLIICVFFLWLASVVAIVLLDWNHPSSFTKGKYFPRSYKSSRRNNRKKNKGEDENQRLANTRSLCSSLSCRKIPTKLTSLDFRIFGQFSDHFCQSAFICHYFSNSAV